MQIKKYFLAAVVLFGAASSSAAYADLFAGEITIDGVEHHVSYNSVTEAINAFSNGGLEKLFPEYNAETSTVSGDVSLRGLPATFSYSGNTLNFSVPSAGINETFSGDSRSQSQTELKDWFKGQGTGALTSLLRGTVEYTPFDPIAGNPTSLMSQMVGRSYSLGDLAWQGAEGISKNQGLFNIAPVYANDHVDANGYQSVTLPINYARYFNGGHTVIFVDFPIQASRIGNAKDNTYTAMLGLGLQQTMTRYWSLTPSIYGGGAGSMSLGSAALAYNAAIKSRLHTDPLKRFSMGLNNVFAYLKTLPLSLGGYNINYNLHNWAYANGVDATYLFSPTSAMKGYFTNTYFAGSPWYIKDYSETGLQWMKIRNNFGLYSTRFYLGAGYLFGAKGFSGFNAKIGTTF